MISAIRYSEARNTSSLGQNKPLSPHHAKNTQPSQNSISFKGGLGEFGTYFLADAVAIIIGCGIVDACVHSILKTKEKNEAREFALEKLKLQNSDDLKKIEHQAQEVIEGLNVFQDKSTKKLTKKIRQSYNKNFNTELFIDKQKKPKEKNLNQVAKDIIQLQDSVKSVFVKLNDKDSYSAVARPFLKTLRKAQNKLY
ncbi:MAG: hypothetical protein PHE78_04780 [Candidatus Gastranaerophilales bacterium]|nr:hypothetical protein [Candidatus Gastranaerophilales bacterium]